MYNKLKDQCKLLNLPAAPTRAPPTRKRVLKIKDVLIAAHQRKLDAESTKIDAQIKQVEKKYEIKVIH